MDYNWVEERAMFSVYRMFLHLRHDTEKDVSIRNSMLRANGRFSFTGDNDTFLVIDNVTRSCVDFKRALDHLDIVGVGAATRATITLSNDKTCKWVVGGVEVDSWQLRKRALEALFEFAA